MSEPTIPQLIELYLRGDPVNAWPGKFAEHTPAPGTGHSEATNIKYALAHLAATSIDLPPGSGPGSGGAPGSGGGIDPRATRQGVLPGMGASRHIADLEANQLRPSDLRHVQQRLVQLQRSMASINRNMQRCVQFFEWCTQYEYMRCEVLTGLKTIRPLRPGRPGVVQPQRTCSPRPEVLRRVVECASWLLRQAMTIQCEGGMRPGELVAMRVCDLRLAKYDEGVVWEYRPQRFKTQHRGGTRIIPFDAAAQQVLREVVEYMHGQEALPGLPEDVRGTPRLGDAGDTRPIWWRAVGPTGKAEGWRYANSYGAAIERACKRAGAKMTPMQLRKLGVTVAAREAGEETAAEFAGHTDAKMTRAHYIDPEVVEANATARARAYALSRADAKAIVDVTSGFGAA